MFGKDMSPEELLGVYETAELPPNGLILDLIERSGELVDLLVARVAKVPPGPDPDDPEPLAGPDVRATWLLLHLREPRALPVLDRVLADPRREALAEEIVPLLPAWGPEVVPLLARVLAARSAAVHVRAAAAEALSELGMVRPELRETITGILGPALLGALRGTPGPTGCRLAFAAAVGLLDYGDDHYLGEIRAALDQGWFEEIDEGDLIVGDALREREAAAKVDYAWEPFNLVLERRVLPWTSPGEALDEDEFLDEAWFGDDEPFAGEEDDDEEEEEREDAFGDDVDGPPPEPIRRESPKVGRNAPCPCGSGRKYKRCCGGASA